MFPKNQISKQIQTENDQSITKRNQKYKQKGQQKQFGDPKKQQLKAYKQLNEQNQVKVKQQDLHADKYISPDARIANANLKLKNLPRQQFKKRKIKISNDYLIYSKLDQILDKNAKEGILYLGDKSDAQNYELLLDLNIRAVLTVASNIFLDYPKENKINHLIFPIGLRNFNQFLLQMTLQQLTSNNISQKEQILQKKIVNIQMCLCIAMLEFVKNQILLYNQLILQRDLPQWQLLTLFGNAI